MRIHALQHVAFEDMAAIKDWAREKGHETAATLLYENQPLPGLDDLDMLVVMGGPMNIYEYEKHPWLKAEKQFIAEAVRSGKPVLGICLGAQLMADALGGKVTRNEQKEIGWFPVSILPDAPLPFSALPRTFTAFHWHGDMFSIPPDAVRAAESEACANQAFAWGERAVGLQFHLETTGESMNRLIDNCADELVDGEFIQSRKQMLARTDDLAKANQILWTLLGELVGE